MGIRIALIGSAPSSVELAPFNDPTWEIWACSPANVNAPRVDAWFEMHSLDRKMAPGNEAYLNMLSRHPRVYVSLADPRLPKATVYPIKEVYEDIKGGNVLDSFMQSSVSFMFALAIMQKPEFIGLWGIDMAAEEEYAHQRPGVQFFIRECHLRGIKVVAPKQSDILEPLPLYGYKEHLTKYWRMRAREQEIKKRMVIAENALEKAKQQKAQWHGVWQEMQYEKQTYMRGDYGKDSILMEKD